jgi:hypothetical protein
MKPTRKRRPEKTGPKEVEPAAKPPAPHSGRFVKGRSGNPSGRPIGALNRSSRLAAILFEGQAEALAQRAVEMALAGDVQALRLVLERLVPPARERALDVTLPALAKASDLPAISARIVALVASGELLPDEGAKLAALLSGWRESLEFAELEARIAALESVR